MYGLQHGAFAHTEQQAFVVCPVKKDIKKQYLSVLRC